MKLCPETSLQSCATYYSELPGILQLLTVSNTHLDVGRWLPNWADHPSTDPHPDSLIFVDTGVWPGCVLTRSSGGWGGQAARGPPGQALRCAVEALVLVKTHITGPRLPVSHRTGGAWESAFHSQEKRC